MPLSSFVLACQVITLVSKQTDRDCPAAYEPSHQTCDIRMNAFASNTARASAQVLIEPRSPHYGFLNTWLTKPSTESLNPEAAVVPALVSIFDSEVTSLECVTTRPLGYVLPSSSHTLLIEQNPMARPMDSNALSDPQRRNQKLKVLTAPRLESLRRSIRSNIVVVILRGFLVETVIVRSHRLVA